MAAASPALPLVADRVVLSHVGWRRYAATREPAVSLIRAAGGLPLSGVQLRRHFPQVCGEALQNLSECAASCGNCELWGWFQFHSAVWAPHEERWRSLFTPVPPLATALYAALRRLTCSRELYVVHLRVGKGRREGGGDGSAGEGCLDYERVECKDNELNSSGSTINVDEHGGSCNSEGSSGEGGNGKAHARLNEVRIDEWEDRNTFWPTPSTWYMRWLSELAAAEGWATRTEPSRPAVLVCSDVEASAEVVRQQVHAELGGGCVVVQWGQIDASDEWRELQRVWARLDTVQPSALSMFVDWWSMTIADGLAISNSTFSFTAAMLNKNARREERSVSHFVRPVPDMGCLCGFEPWNSSPLLRCGDEVSAKLYSVGRGAYG